MIIDACYVTMTATRIRHHSLLSRQVGRCQDDVTNSPLKSLHFRDEVK